MMTLEEDPEKDDEEQEKVEDNENISAEENQAISPEARNNNNLLQRYLDDSVGALDHSEIFIEPNENTSITPKSKFIEDDVPESKCIEDDDESQADTDRMSTRKSKAYSTRSMSTIPPEDVKARVRKEQNKQRQKLEKKRMIVKGEASAVSRKRRENQDTIKDCTFFSDW